MNGGINGFAHSPGRVNGGPASAASSPRKSPGKADSAAWAHFEDYEKLHTAYLAQERALAEALDDIQQLTLERDTALADKVAAEKELEQVGVSWFDDASSLDCHDNMASLLHGFFFFWVTCSCASISPSWRIMLWLWKMMPTFSPRAVQRLKCRLQS